MAESEGSKVCICTDISDESSTLLSPHCVCPRDEHDIVIHEETCLMFKNERIIYPHEPEICECVTPPYEEGLCKCCGCLPDQCFCKRAGREAFDEWRAGRDVGEMPAVLESTHPLMQRFQQTLKQFLEKENAIAEEEILQLRDDLRLSKEAYDADLETIYRSDHDTNAQRVMIEEYEATLGQKTNDREQAEQHAKELGDRYKKLKDKLDQDIATERETIQEVEALTTLCRQLEKWREETESDLTVSQRMSDKMRAEKKTLADEKRELDIIIYGLSNEVWKLESRLEMFKKQFEIKNAEMENVNDKVTAYASELEDLDLDKRRLVSLWNAVLINIQQRDKVYDSVRDDYKNLTENYRTLVNNLEITKKVAMEEMNKGKELFMNKDKLLYDIDHATKLYDAEDTKKAAFDAQISELQESVEMNERDQEMIKSENFAMMNILKSTEKEYDHKVEAKLKLENDILANLQECLLNDKAVESMANGIRKMREMSRKQEISLMSLETQHARMMLEIEVYKNRQARNNILLEETLSKVRSKEKEIDQLEEKYDQKVLLITKKQRELDLTIKKYTALKEIFDLKSPQERRIEEMEQHIKALRERTEHLQHEWLRLQGHVVKLSAQHHKLVADINLINKQIQICEQKIMRIQVDCDNVAQEQVRVERVLRDLRGQLEVLQRTRKDAAERNVNAQRANVAITHEYTANLKGAEAEIIQLEEDIDTMDKEKSNLTQELDKIQKEALIWQRKGILAVELKRNIQNAKSAVGEIGQMKNEIHRMEVRREQLHRTGQKLAEDLAQYVTRRETAMEKSRAAAAVEKAHGSSTQTSQFTYHHKLRLAKADLARVTKDLAEAKANMEQLCQEQAILEKEVEENSSANAELEEQVATLLRECRELERQKQWILERVVRSQRLGSELATAIKRQSVRVRKPKSVVMTEHNQAKALNDKLRYVVDNLAREYPYLSDKFEAVCNTLNIHSPSDSPRIVQECVSTECIVEEENMAERPLEYDE
ncbi:coiled-coil domain-containing protein 40 [Plodia interpunctella]|uniref:coiled-coil domain-containing protein 40 n=1 Tax=Plodia interpunctella TaxID=58824 RepID=UPI00236899B7|nr:coiled-coil domain-containing protein 40 [Plodia interpunctella]